VGTTISDTGLPKASLGQDDPTWMGASENAASGLAGPTIEADIPADSAATSPPSYPYNSVFELDGHVLEMDRSSGSPRARYRHPSGTTILIDPDGSVHIRTAGSQYYEPGGDFVVNLREGSTFKVVYPQGTSMACGAQGFHVRGHTATILGRLVAPLAETI
jgi:hypothetical protein